jgi:hypothetical protein
MMGDNHISSRFWNYVPEDHIGRTSHLYRFNAVSE